MGGGEKLRDTVFLLSPFTNLRAHRNIIWRPEAEVSLCIFEGLALLIQCNYIRTDETQITAYDNCCSVPAFEFIHIEKRGNFLDTQNVFKSNCKD